MTRPPAHRDAPGVGPQGAGDRPERPHLHPGSLRSRALPAAAGAGRSRCCRQRARRAARACARRSGRVSTATRRPRSTYAARCLTAIGCCWCASAATAAGRCRAAGWMSTTRPSEAVVREILEESGYRARAVKLAALGRQEPPPAPAGRTPHLQADVPVRTHRRCGTRRARKPTRWTSFRSAALPQLSTGRILRIADRAALPHQLRARACRPTSTRAAPAMSAVDVPSPSTDRA